MSARRKFSLLFAGLLALAGADAANAQLPEKGPVPIGNPGDWVKPSDYPIDAFFNQQSGTTQFMLEIDDGGHPKSCRIVKSSGVKSLDRKTCAFLMERARFQPGVDSQGRAVEAYYSNRVSWVLPNRIEDLPPRYTIELTLNPDGIVEDCTIVERTSVYGKSDPCENRVGQKMWSADPRRPTLIVRVRQTIEFELPDE